MAEKELAIKRLQQRHDTAQNWKVKNPILAEGELGVETDTGNIKAGNGATTWNSLPYSNAGLGGGSSEDCLKSTGGVFNGTSEFVDFFGEPKVGTLYETSQDSPSLKLAIDDTLDIGSRTVESDEATGIPVSGSNISLGNEALIALAPTVMMGGLAKNEMYGQTCSTYVGLEGGHQSSITLFPGVSSNILDDYYLGNSMTATAGASFSGILGASLFHNISLYGRKELKVSSDSDTPLWNDQPMPLTVNGVAPDETGNIEIEAGGGGDDGYFPSNSYLIDTTDAPTVSNGTTHYVQVYDPLSASNPPPKQILMMGTTLDGSTPSIMPVMVLLGTEDEIQNGSNESVKSVIGFLIPMVADDGSEVGLGMVQCHKATDKPLWISFDFKMGYVIPSTAYY